MLETDAGRTMRCTNAILAGLTGLLLAGCQPGMADLGAPEELTACPPAKLDGLATDDFHYAYGSDGREDLCTANPLGLREDVLKWSRSTAILLKESDFLGVQVDASRERTMQVACPSLAERYEKSEPLCSSEPFRQQPSCAGAATGFLVAPDILATPAHTLRQMRCDQLMVVFDFSLVDDSQALWRDDRGVVYEVTDADLRVRRCADVWFHPDYERGGGWQPGDDPASDVALILLDRAVNDRPVLPLAEGDPVDNGDDLVMLGHPKGLPLKAVTGQVITPELPITLPGSKREVVDLEGGFFARMLNFSGNSGSPVLDRSGAVRGIFVDGGLDWFKTAGSCQRSSFRSCIASNSGGSKCLPAYMIHADVVAGLLDQALSWN